MANGAVPSSLDPADWTELRRCGRRMLEDMFDHLETLRDQTLWQPPSRDAVARFREALPTSPTELASVHAQFLEAVLPYSSGNAHPGFMGWVQGGGTAVGMLAEMLAAGMNANLGGRHHMAIEVERQILAWTKEIFGFPDTSSGLLVTGTSAANFIAVLVARTRALGDVAKQSGLAALGRELTAYTSAAAHGSIARSMEMAGLGRDQLRQIAVDGEHRMRIAALRAAIARDRAGGKEPFMLIGNAGTVDTGAIDDLTALADVAAEEGLYLHVDGAFGALAILVPELAPRLAGIERADSLAFDWHKLGQVPYDCGCILVRDADLHRRTFAADAGYLSRAQRGLAGGEWWPCDYGPDLSRGFRALKTWFTLKTYGVDAIGRVIAGTVALARHLAARVQAEPELELLGPSSLNVVCFGYRGAEADWLNAEIVADLHEAGRVAPSLTKLDGRTAIRAAIVNHRTTEADVDLLVDSVLKLGRSAQFRQAA
ncbi:MAG TPA: pyridoxal-dependent decarboxylase [Acetobacteraceae bacterium]|nr:pyridoxal-dependent decarboxylase [Acetobacteraceae bacterium]